MKKHKIVLGVIGGGSIAVSYISQLTKLAIEKNISNEIEICVFEKRDRVGAGMAYEEDLWSNILNTRADAMSAICNDKRNFVNWARVNESLWRVHMPELNISDDSFLPRPLFGMYLDSLFVETVSTAQQAGLKITHVKDEIVDLEPQIYGFKVISESGSEYVVDFAVLCVGNLPSNKFNEFVGNPGFMNSPYPCSQMIKHIDADSTVGILGSNLSAIDAVVALSNSNHRGKIICMSRNGRLPSVRGKLTKNHKLKYLTLENINKISQKSAGKLTLKSIIELVHKEISTKATDPFDVAEILNEDSGVYDYIDTEIHESLYKDRAWQSVIYSLNDVIDVIWHKLSLADKMIFFNVYRSKWMSYRVSFPIENAMVIKEMLRKEALQVIGGISSITFDEKEMKYNVTCEDKRWKLKSYYEVDYLINATGGANSVKRSRVPLIRNLLERKIASENPFSGFNVDYESGNLINSLGAKESKIYVQGSLATGTYFWTNAMDVNARVAYHQAQHLVNEIASSNIVRYDDNEGKHYLLKMLYQDDRTQSNLDVI